ncbi:thiamine phosphate synthase [Sphingomonas sp.]|uniref:thiamine phosphate synthase n=1 Tax=Sphingomonas sp. TaxID=28214 RepID=UPI003AFFC530
MPPRHPRLWLMTDERMGDGLWRALERLPRGAGVVFRHYGLPTVDRRHLFAEVRAVARRRRLVLLLGGTPREAIGWRADGSHGRSRHRWSARPLLRSAPCHGRRALIAARRDGVALRFVSPLHATRSHPGALPLGRVRTGLAIIGERRGLIALGGMTARRFAAARELGFQGWAAIDAWSA